MIKAGPVYKLAGVGEVLKMRTFFFPALLSFVLSFGKERKEGWGERGLEEREDWWRERIILEKN